MLSFLPENIYDVAVQDTLGQTSRISGVTVSPGLNSDIGEIDLQWDLFGNLIAFNRNLSDKTYNLSKNQLVLIFRYGTILIYSDQIYLPNKSRVLRFISHNNLREWSLEYMIF